MNVVCSHFVQLSQDQLLQCWQEHSTHGQPPRTPKDMQDDITAHNPLHEPQAHGISMKIPSTPSRRAMSSSFSVRHICSVLVTACRALSWFHSRHTLGISCRGVGQGVVTVGLVLPW